MTDLTKALAAKSDQLNADDLIAGPITIKITMVKVDNTAEQKIVVNFDGDNGKPWKPCKTAGRCLASIWGADSSGWVGKSCTLYRDENVTWAGVAVGGIRVSHAEGITKPKILNLAKATNKKAEIVILPLIVNNLEQKKIDVESILEQIKKAYNPEELKAMWEDVKNECKQAQDYEALETIKAAVIEKNEEFKKGNENA